MKRTLRSWQERARKGLKLLDEQLRGRKFLVDDRYSIADIGMFGYTHVLEQAGLDLSDYPAIAEWIGHVQDTQGFASLSDLAEAAATRGGRSRGGVMMDGGSPSVSQPALADAFSGENWPSDGQLLFIDHLATPIWIFDIDHSRVVWANLAGLKVWCAETLEELRARDLGRDMSVSVAKRLRQYQEDFEHQGAAFSELWTLYPKGEPKTLRVIYSGIRLSDGRMAMFCEGLAHHSETPETLRSAEALLHATVMISLYDEDGRPLYRNPPPRADLGRDDISLGSRFVEVDDYQRLRISLNERGEARLVARIRASRGVQWHEITARECRDAVTGSPAILISETDVSDLKQTEEKAHFLALHDVLTGLKNRTFVQQEFQGLLENARMRGESVGLLFVDIDRFKNINDSLGHAFGDELLIEVAHRLQKSVREMDVVCARRRR